MMTRQRLGSTLSVGCFALALLAVAFLDGCSGSAPAASPSACWSAMLAQYQHDLATGATGTEPPQCRGVADSVIQSYALRLMSGNTEAPTP
jgi:hypothetical protein